MFQPEDVADNPALPAEVEADVLAECSKLGPVEKVKVYKLHPDGVVSVKFKQEEHVQGCIAKMNGRWFGGLQIAAHRWDGVTNYALVKAKDSVEQEEARLDAFAKELEK